jgi:hypothetical protein
METCSTLLQEAARYRRPGPLLHNHRLHGGLDRLSSKWPVPVGY